MTPDEKAVSLRQFRQIPLLRNSERTSFKTCQYQWQWGWNESLELAMPRQDARWFGSAWHVVWAQYYMPGFIRGRDPHETWDEQMKSAYNVIATGDYFGEDEEREWVDARELGHLMIDGQLARWKGDPAWEVLAPEQRFKAKIPFNERQAKSPLSHWISLGFVNGASGNIADLRGTFDLPIRDHNDGHIKVVDWKTAASHDPVSAWLVKDDQVGTYISVGTMVLRKLGLIKPDEAVTGGIWSYARKQKPDDRPKDEQGRALNKDGSISKRQPAPLFWREEVNRNKHNRLRQIARVADDAEQIQMVRNGVVAPTKNPGKHCAWCDFKELCDIDENGGDTEQYKKDVFKVVDKYVDHRPGAANSKV